jgi:hypothetical protein
MHLSMASFGGAWRMRAHVRRVACGGWRTVRPLIVVLYAHLGHPGCVVLFLLQHYCTLSFWPALLCLQFFACHIHFISQGDVPPVCLVPPALNARLCASFKQISVGCI